MLRLALLLMMLLAAPELRAASASATKCRDGLIPLLGKIQSDSLDPIGARDLVMAGLSGLSAAQPHLKVTDTGEHLTLSLRGQPAGLWPEPEDGTDNEALAQWMKPMAAALDVLSPEIGDDATAWEDACVRILEGALQAAHTRNAYVSEQGRICPSAIGIEIDASPVGPRISHVTPSTPAAREDIRVGDIVRRIDGKDVGRLPLNTVRERLCGPVDESVGIDLIRNGQTLSKDLVRIPANLSPAGTVRDNMRGTVQVIAINALSQNTYREFKAALNRGRDAGMTALVLDLRNNPGGLLEQIVAITDQFVDSGPLLTTRSRRQADTQRFNARPGTLGLPTAVLVDGNSFLGAEAITAILQERAGAVVIGTATPGRGEIATILPIPGFISGGYIRLVTASLETPSGLPIGGRGVLPNICTAGGKVRALPEDATKQWPAANVAAVDALRALCPPGDRAGDTADIDAAVDWLTHVRR